MDLHRIHGGGGGEISDTPSRCTLKEPGEAHYRMGCLAQVLFFPDSIKALFKRKQAIFLQDFRMCTLAEDDTQVKFSLKGKNTAI